MEYTYFDCNQMKAMGKRIKKIRKKHSMTQEQLAKLLGISSDQISNIELGKSACKTDHIFLLTQIFNISADFLLKGGGREVVSEITDEQITYLISLLNNRRKMVIYELLTCMK